MILDRFFGGLDFFTYLYTRNIKNINNETF